MSHDQQSPLSGRAFQSHALFSTLRNNLSQFFQLTERGRMPEENFRAVYNTLPLLIELAEMDVILKLHPSLKASLHRFKVAWSQVKDVVANFQKDSYAWTNAQHDTTMASSPHMTAFEEYLATPPYQQVAISLTSSFRMIVAKEPVVSASFLSFIYDWIRNEAHRIKEIYSLVNDICTQSESSNQLSNTMRVKQYKYSHYVSRDEIHSAGSLGKNKDATSISRSGSATNASDENLPKVQAWTSTNMCSVGVTSAQTVKSIISDTHLLAGTKGHEPRIFDLKPPFGGSFSTSSSQPCAPTFNLGIICTKRHEFDNMYTHIRDDGDFPHEQSLPKVPKVVMGKNSCVSYCVIELPKRALRIVLATFEDDQGLVACAYRVPLLLELFPVMHFILMPGICGGTKLGRVLIGMDVYGLDLGRRVWDTQAKQYVEKHEFDRYHVGTLVPQHFVDAIVADHNRDHLAKEEYDVVTGTFISVTKVRDDVGVALREVANQILKRDDHPSGLMTTDPWDGRAGVEMESMPLYSSAQIRKVGALVIKGTSDVSWEAFDDSLVEPALARHNIAQLKLVDPNFTPKDAQGHPQDRTSARRLYRDVASKNAAAVTWRCAKRWIEQNRSISSPSRVPHYSPRSESD